jgi:hypothetical protein
MAISYYRQDHNDIEKARKTGSVKNMKLDAQYDTVNDQWKPKGFNLHGMKQSRELNKQNSNKPKSATGLKILGRAITQKSIKAGATSGGVFKKLGNMVNPKAPTKRAFKNQTSFGSSKINQPKTGFEKLKEDAGKHADPYKKFDTIIKNPNVQYNKQYRTLDYKPGSQVAAYA